jgi:hypothetical protein
MDERVKGEPCEKIQTAQLIVKKGTIEVQQDKDAAELGASCPLRLAVATLACEQNTLISHKISNQQDETCHTDDAHTVKKECVCASVLCL